MRIGMVSACYKPVINGVTRMVSLYKEQLTAAAHDVTVFTLGEPDPAGDEPGVIRSPAIPLGDTGYYFSTHYSRQARERLQEMEIIHCHHLFMSVEMAHRYGRCPIVYTNHTRYDLYTGAYIPLPQPAADALMRQIWPDFTDYCDVVITPSESVRQVMLDFGVRRPIEVIENGVELQPFLHPSRPLRKRDFNIPDQDILLVYVGRLASEKNLTTLVEQFVIAHDLVPRLRLMLVGKGPLHDDLRSQVYAAGVADRVHFTGPVAYDQVPNYLAAADLFVTASVTEVHPLTVIEAMAAGLPVAAVSSPGIVDTVESGKSGWLTNFAEGGLAAAMVSLATNTPLRQRLAAGARQASQRFDIRDTVSRTVNLYERLRETRPDLLRDHEHGRWQRARERRQQFVEQLAGLLRPE
ncbi:MAG: glycosyltransferase [Chloroflexota bacterium]